MRDRVLVRSVFRLWLAMYLFADGGDTGYRIHGTTEPETIGTDVSSGCIRMVNQDVIHLYQRVPEGTQVIVLS